MAYKGILVGLGNPGTRYSKTRHNLGFMVVDYLVDNLHASFQKKKLAKASTTLNLVSVSIADVDWLVLKPLEFMNLSGRAVQKTAKKYGVQPQNILVIHDELDLAFSLFKFKEGGGLAGHNGLKSIAECIGSKDFNRLRMGIGRPEPGQSGSEYVLRKFLPEEVRALPHLLAEASEAVKTYCAQGIEGAMRIHHTKVNQASREEH